MYNREVAGSHSARNYDPDKESQGRISASLKPVFNLLSSQGLVSWQWLYVLLFSLSTQPPRKELEA